MSDDPKDFWNLDELIPPRKTPAGKPRFSADTSAVEITVSAQNQSVSVAGRETTDIGLSEPENRYSSDACKGLKAAENQTGEITELPKGDATDNDGVFADGDVPLRERPVNPYAVKSAPKEAPEAVYSPEHSLIREVRIYPWHTAYNYYEIFRTHAIRLNPREGTECAEVDFFSYMPQYTQLTWEQLHYYLWWRTNFRREVYLPAAYSYLLLYLYEQINLSGKIPPGEGQMNILRLWLNYRGVHPRLDVVIREWLCDYSLLHRLPPPPLPSALWSELLSGCRLKEFYVSGWKDTGEEVLAILLFCNNYDYKKSKFYRADTAALYDRVLSGAVGVALRFLREKKSTQSPTAGISTITRDAFAGAVCSYRLKRRLEVDFSSFSHTHELRYIMTDVLKYAENAIRAVISVKSRLTVYQISTELRYELDAYLKTALPQKAPTRYEKTIKPDYEKRYDLPVRPVSPERAARIEAESWETTKKLVEAFEDENAESKYAIAACGAKDGDGGAVKSENFLDSDRETSFFSSRTRSNSENGVKEVCTEVKEAPMKTEEIPALSGKMPENVLGEVGTPPQTALAAALGEWAKFVRLAASGDKAGERRFAESHGEMPDAIADRINTIAGELFGDIILEDAGGFYTVIEDYEEDLRKEGILL